MGLKAEIRILIKFKKITYFLLLAALGHRRCAQAFSGYGQRGLLSITLCRHLFEVAFLVVAHGFWSTGLVVVVLSLVAPSHVELPQIRDQTHVS